MKPARDFAILAVGVVLLLAAFSRSDTRESALESVPPGESEPAWPGARPPQHVLLGYTLSKPTLERLPAPSSLNEVPPKRLNPDPKSAAVRITRPGSGCSGTILKFPDGYYLLTAAHCVRLGGTITVHSPIGKLSAQVVSRNGKVDIALARIRSDGPLPFALVSSQVPKKGDRVWHKGYGVNRPGNVEKGKVLVPGNVKKACWYTTRLSSGDSGSGQFLESDGKLVALGCWGSSGRFGGPSLPQIWAHIGAVKGRRPGLPPLLPRPWRPRWPGCR